MELFKAPLDTRHLNPGFSERSVSAMAAHSCDPAPLTAWHCRGPAFTTLSMMTLVLFGSIFTSIQSDKTRCKRKEWIYEEKMNLQNGHLTYSEKMQKRTWKDGVKAGPLAGDIAEWRGVWWWPLVPSTTVISSMSLEKNYNPTKPATSMFNQNGSTQSPLFGTLSRGFNVSFHFWLQMILGCGMGVCLRLVL